MAIPPNLPAERLIFSANRFVSNGKVPEITHIVYVDLEGYSQLSEQSDMRDIGRAVGRLNKLLPKRQFILIGPGRWGSRGDIKLGVPVTYSDINNTAMLIEVARQEETICPTCPSAHIFSRTWWKHRSVICRSILTILKRRSRRSSCAVRQCARGAAARICALV